MLTSLFGDLRAIRSHGRDTDADDETQGFAATAIMESTATEVNDNGQMVDRHLSDLVVSGSPAQAIRQHFASTRADLDTANRLIAILDPTGMWASGVIKALSDASGRPVERLHLREQGTLRTLAVIERTTLERRNEDTLRIYHADVRAPGGDNAAIPVALMERSHLTAVIVGAMSPHAIDDMLRSLHTSVSEPEWRCPTLLFMLPPNAVWIANKIAMIDWPQRLRVQVLNESLTSASAVWNALLGMWNRVKSVPTFKPTPVNAPHGLEDFPIKVADLHAAEAEQSRVATGQATELPDDAELSPEEDAVLHAALAQPTEPPMARVATITPLPVAAARATTPTLSFQAAQQAINSMAGIDGLIGGGIVDASTGMMLARHTTDDSLVLELAAAGATQVLRAHQQAARQMGMADELDEIITSAGTRHHVLRTVSHHKGLFLFAVLDKQRTNLALARYKLMEAEQNLA